MFALSEFDVCNVDCASFTCAKFTLQCKAHLQHYDFSFSSIQLQIAFKSPVFNCSSLHALLCPDFFKIMIFPPRPMLVVYALHLWVQLCKLWGLCNVRCKTAHRLLYSDITCVCQWRNALNIWKQYILKFRQIRLIFWTNVMYVNGVQLEFAMLRRHLWHGASQWGAREVTKIWTNRLALKIPQCLLPLAKYLPEYCTGWGVVI